MPEALCLGQRHGIGALPFALGARGRLRSPLTSTGCQGLPCTQTFAQSLGCRTLPRRGINVERGELKHLSRESSERTVQAKAEWNLVGIAVVWLDILAVHQRID